MRKLITIGLIIVQPEPHCRRYTQVSRIHQRNRVPHKLACYRCGESFDALFGDSNEN